MDLARPSHQDWLKQNRRCQRAHRCERLTGLIERNGRAGSRGRGNQNAVANLRKVLVSLDRLLEASLQALHVHQNADA